MQGLDYFKLPIVLLITGCHTFYTIKIYAIYKTYNCAHLSI